MSARAPSLVAPTVLAAFAAFTASRAEAAPAWAKTADTADAQGHSFVCQGTGKAEQDAIAAAQGICNDKICKVCGVEVESITETKETLTGVDFQRKVVERCRRVRSGDTKVLFKSSDCGPDGCTAWIQIRYTKEDEQRECPRYAKEDFADPAACEQDIDAFAKLESRTARSFHDRTALLDAALIHCDKIDVRPTPAILALDAKLSHGMDAFEFRQRETGRDDTWKPLWGWYLAEQRPLRRQIAETKFLTGRIQLVRDYVHAKALTFDVIEATTAKDWGTPAGLARMHAALQKAPTGRQYGAPDVHFVGLFEMGHSKVDTSAIGALLRRLYPPDQLEFEHAWNLALYFGGDQTVTEDEWRYMFAVHKKRRCDNCLRVLLEKPDHGSGETRVARFFEAWKTVPGKDLAKPQRAFSVFKTLTGYHDPSLVLALEPRVPAEVSAFFDYDYFYEFVTRFGKDTPGEARTAMIARATKALAAGPSPAGGRGEEGFCYQLADSLKHIEKLGGDVAEARGRSCSCLSGPLRKVGTGSVNKSDLIDFARKHSWRCAGVNDDE